MKYSLRSLMVVVTLICVALGGVMGRAEYMRSWADFHHRRAEALEVKLEAQDKLGGTDSLEESLRIMNDIDYHLTMEDRYRAAMYRLLVGVDDSGLDKPAP
jgi:hypothetical protein